MKDRNSGEPPGSSPVGAAIVSLERALSIVLAEVVPLGRETVPLDETGGRVLAETVRADRDSPPFDRSAMDGFAVRARDTREAGTVLDLLEDVPAGALPERPVGPGTASRVLTGAPIPPGADAVQMVEKTETLAAGRKVRVLAPVLPGKNIRRRGEEVTAGEVVLEPGVPLQGPEIGYLAWVGKDRTAVHLRPRVGIVVTGDELVEPHHVPMGAQIRNSNGPMLSAMVREGGGVPFYLGMARDEPGSLRTLLEKGLCNDVLLVSGGVSVGERDLVASTLEGLKVSLRFHRVAIKPGKPMLFGRRDRAVVFGLPGNPVSCLMIFHVFVLPLMRRLMGLRKVESPLLRATLGKPIRRNPKRFGVHQARLERGPEGWKVEAVRTTGSGDLLSCTQANAMILVPRGTTPIEAGERVEVLLVEGFAFR